VVSAGPAARPAAARTGDAAAVARGGLANLVGAAVSAIANFALVVLVARRLDPAAAGAFFGVTSLFLIVETVGRLGSDTGAVYFVARWRALQELHRIRAGLRAAAVPVLGVTTTLAAAVLVLAPWLSGVVADGSGRSTQEIRLLAVLIPVAVGYDLTLAATRGFGRMRASVLLERTARPALQLVLAAVVLGVGAPGWLAAAWGLPYVLVVVLAIGALHRLTAGLPVQGVPAREVGREFWTFALPRAVAGAAQILLQRLDIVLVAALRGPRDAAIYTAASRFLVLGQFVTQAIAAPVQPRLSGALAGGDTGRARSLYALSTTWIVLVSWPLFTLAAAFAPTYLGIFGAHYGSHAAIAVVVLLAASMLVASGVGIVDSVIIMAGRTSWNLATTLLAVAINVVLDLALIPHFGIVGAAIGWCAAILAANVVPLAVAWRGLGLHPFGAGVAWGGASSLLAFAALPLVGRLLAGTGGAFAGAALGAVLYAAIVWRLREPFELSALRRRRVDVPA
jgi:O-antigen/teichoic acid export membrane protein